MDGDNAMQTALRPRKLTCDDVVLFPDDGLRHEIIDGEHYVTASPVPRHQLLVGRLYFEIESYLRAHRGRGLLFHAPLDVVLSRWDVVEPDLLLIAGDQRGILTDTNVQGPPALVIEILSPNTRARDERLKRDLFDRNGVGEYWLVDPDANLLTAFRRDHRGILQPMATRSAEDGAVLTTPLLPGFSLALADLFAQIHG